MSFVENLDFCNQLQGNLKLKEFHGVRYALGTRFRKCENLSSIFDELVREVDGDEAVGLIKELLIICGYGRLLKKDAYLLPMHGDSFRIFHGAATFEEQEIKGMEERAVIVQVISRLIDNPNNWEKFRNYMYAFASIPKKADRQLEDMFDELREFDEQKQLGITRLKEILAKLRFCELEAIVNRFQGVVHVENEVEYTSAVQHETDGILQSARKRTERSKDESLHKDEFVTDNDCSKQQQKPPTAPSGNQPQYIQSLSTVHSGGTQTSIMIPAGNVTFNAPLVIIPPLQWPPTTAGGMMTPNGKSPAQSPTRAKSPNIHRNLSKPEEEIDKNMHKSI